MDNLASISVDSNPILLESVIDTTTEESIHQQEKFISNIKMFSLDDSNVEKLTIHPIQFKKFVQFEPEKCYILLHFKKHFHENFQYENSEEKLTIHTILKSAKNNLTPRGLEYSFSLFQNTSNDFDFDLYLWNGINSSNNLRAECIGICCELERNLNNNLNLETLFHKGKPVSIEENFPGETMDSTTFKSYLNKMLLFKNLTYSNEIPLVVPELFGNEKLKAKEKMILKKLRKVKIDNSAFKKELSLDLSKTSSAKRKSTESTESQRKKTPRTPRRISIPKVATQTPISSSSSSQRSTENHELFQIIEPMQGASVVPIYLKIISKIRDQLYLGSDNMARNKQQLINNGITHILNCAKITCDEYFPEDFVYKSLNLFDAGVQPVIGLFFEAVQFIESAISNGGKVFVHCVQGVSRSSTFVIAYLIWKERQTFRLLNEDVKSKRTVCSPNAGFIVQLMRWENLILHNHFLETLLFRISPLNSHYGKSHKQIGPLLCDSLKLDSRTCFVLYNYSKFFIWIGSKMKDGFEERAKQFIACFQYINDIKIENEVEILNDDLETEEFIKSLRKVSIPKFTRISETTPYPELKLFDLKDSFVLQKEKELKKKKKAKLFNYDEDDYFDDYGTFNKLDLSSDELFVLAPEDENVIFVWRGIDEKTMTNGNLMELGEKFIKEKKKFSNCLIITVEEGNEPNEFWVYFE